MNYPTHTADTIDRFLLLDALMKTKQAKQHRAKGAASAIAAMRIKNLLAKTIDQYGDAGGRLTLTLDEPLLTSLGAVTQAHIHLLEEDVVADIIYCTDCGKTVSLKAL